MCRWGEEEFFVNPLGSFWSSEHSEYVLSVVNEPFVFGAIPFCLLCVKPESPTAIFVKQKETQRKRIRYQLVEDVLKPLATVMKSIQQEAASLDKPKGVPSQTSDNGALDEGSDDGTTSMPNESQTSAFPEVSANETVYTKMFDPTVEGFMCNIL
jgi:hypothetical protein